MIKRRRVIDRSRSKTKYGLEFLNASSKEAFLNNIRQLTEGASDDATFRFTQRYDEIEFEIISFRDETDEEVEKRLLRSKNASFRAKQAREKAKANLKMEELRELSRLQNKYGLTTKKDGV